MKNKEIAKKCGDSTILSGHRNIGSSDHRNLDGIYTDVFGGGCPKTLKQQPCDI